MNVQHYEQNLISILQYNMHILTIIIMHVNLKIFRKLSYDLKLILFFFFLETEFLRILLNFSIS